MNKLFLRLTGILILTTIAISCGKTTKGKLSNEWKVIEYKEELYILNPNQNTYSNIVSGDDKALTFTTYSNAPPLGPESYTVTQSVNKHELIIKKDGTWSLVRDCNDGIHNSVLSSSGTWSFTGKNKAEDFKKNERIIFNTLSESQTYTGNSSSNTYITGEKVHVYTVVESTAKKLKLFLEKDSDLVMDNTPYGSSTSIEMTLERK